MNRRTLAGRLALVQSGITLVALATVMLGTSLTATAAHLQRTDRLLEGAVRHVRESIAPFDPTALDPAWLEDELAEIRPSPAVRVELLEGSRIVAASGPGPSPAARPPGCHEEGAFRACAARSGPFTIVASVDRANALEAQRHTLIALLAVIGLTGALVSLASLQVARRALAPLTELTARIAEIEPGSGARAHAESEFAELERLRARFDELVVRFDQALERERRIAVQASHELRTPLGVARAEVEALPQTPRFAAGRTRALAALDRLAELIERLLWFARAQGRLDEAKMSIVNIADVLRDQLAERERSDVRGAISSDLPDEALVRGDEQLLGRVTANLLDNAFKYGDGRRIDVCADRAAGSVRVHVASSGAGPVGPSAARLFEPFYRGARDAPRVQGFGLGLPFARAVARAHGGDVELAARGGGEMTEFVLTLPLVHWDESTRPRVGS